MTRASALSGEVHKVIVPVNIATARHGLQIVTVSNGVQNASCLSDLQNKPLLTFDLPPWTPPAAPPPSPYGRC
jgi:hypothetical protein